MLHRVLENRRPPAVLTIHNLLVASLPSEELRLAHALFCREGALPSLPPPSSLLLGGDIGAGCDHCGFTEFRRGEGLPASKRSCRHAAGVAAVTSPVIANCAHLLDAGELIGGLSWALPLLPAGITRTRSAKTRAPPLRLLHTHTRGLASYKYSNQFAANSRTAKHRELALGED
jgi:hypothetical protein